MAESVIKQLREEGLIHKDSFTANCLVTQIPLIDQSHPPAFLAPTVKVKVLNIYWDICADCGAEYCTRFEVVDMPAQVQMQKQPGRMPPGLSGMTRN
jgi:hypothetical protein